MSTRIRLSAGATLAGWLAATLVTLLVEAPQLWRNAPPNAVLLHMAAGLALWVTFTLLVTAGVWCLVVLPLAMLVPAKDILRRRRELALGSSATAVLVVGWKLKTWYDLATQHGPDSPLASPLFLTYAGFGLILGLVTTLVYARLLRDSLHLRAARSPASSSKLF